MSPLRKYQPIEVPKDPVHPVDVMLDLILWSLSLALVILLIRWMTGI